jgi:hypothetical protein
MLWSKPKTALRIISDVHGKYAEYHKVVKTCEYSVCTGDVGFNYDCLIHFMNPEFHKFFCGNHDCRERAIKCPNHLGEYGYIELGGIKFFYYSGAFSIDKEFRQDYNRKNFNKIWWEDEELSYKKGKEALKLYKKVKPDLVLTHDCPREISKLTGNPQILRNLGFNPDTFTNTTQEVLDEYFKIHQPKLWIYGHYHHNIDIPVNNTRFICRPELGWTDLDENLNIIDLSLPQPSVISTGHR